PVSNPMRDLPPRPGKQDSPMTSLSGKSSTAPTERFRAAVRLQDTDAVERLVRATGVFNEGEVGIARELVDECLAKGEAASGYSFLFADGEHGLDGYVCYGAIPGTVGRSELYWIAVHPKTQGKGLAARLQKAAEDAVRAQGAVRMIAETSTRA